MRLQAFACAVHLIPIKLLAICVIDVTTGPNSPLKVGPLLTTADAAVMTKGDLVSQAEREVFRERILEANPGCRIIEANGLSGKGSAEIAELIRELARHLWRDGAAA